MLSLEKIEEYLDGVNIDSLSMEELEHYTNIVIAIDNKKLDNLQRTKIEEELQ